MTMVERSWADQIAVMRKQWQALGHSSDRVPPEWPQRLVELRQRRHELMGKGQWRSGPRTLMAAVGWSDLELRLTAGLAWLLRPDGHHGLGPQLLRALLATCGEPESRLTGVRIAVEDSRDDGRTRADLVAYGSDWTLVIEAKVRAAEQPAQLHRLYELWRDDPAPRFVFLTRERRTPATASGSAGAWALLTWSDLARLLRTAIGEQRGDVAPGVNDYLQTLEVHHRV